MVELCAGVDGKDRVAKVRVKGKVITRPFQRLYPMEVGSDEDTITELVKQKPIKVLKRPGKVATVEDKRPCPSPVERVNLGQKSRTGREIKTPARFL